MDFQADKQQPSFTVGSFGVVDRMIHGLGTVQSELIAGHPLEKRLKQSTSERDRLNFSMLRKTQGLHAPMRLVMERKAAFQVRRLPCLTSSHAMLETLTGQDEMIVFEDILNDPNDSEVLVQPHVSMEKSLGLI